MKKPKLWAVNGGMQKMDTRFRNTGKAVDFLPKEDYHPVKDYATDEVGVSLIKL